jgi:hypothetical protein
MLLRRGSVGNAVAVVQYALNGVTSFMPKLKCDGLFGPKTEERVRQHQSRQRLQPDGVVGPLTLDSLFEIVTLTCKTRFKQYADTRNGAAPTGLRVNPPLNGASAPGLNWLSPATAEYLRQQQAFWTWWAQLHPKPPMPQPQTVVVPTPGPWGPVYLPVTHQQIVLPDAKTAKVQLTAPAEGGSFSIGPKGEASVDVLKRKFKEAEYGIGFDWVMLKGRYAELEVGASVARDHKGDLSGEAEVTLKGGAGLTLKTKLGQLGWLKFMPYLATAITSESAVKASGGFKAYAEMNITKLWDRYAVKASIGIKGGPKIVYGPVKQPDGREEHQLIVTPFGATGFITLDIEFP